MTHRKMIAGLAGMAVAAGGTGVALAATAPKHVTVSQSDGMKVVPNKYVQDMLRFNKDVYTVKSGGTVTLKMTQDQEGPHTLSVVRAKDLPKTARQVNNCAVCNKLNQAYGFDPNSNAPPKFLFLENGVGSATPPKLDKVGDSALVINKGDTVNMTVAAKPGAVLHFLCLIHPQMQAEVKVVK
jgi:plastocyanin